MKLGKSSTDNIFIEFKLSSQSCRIYLSFCVQGEKKIKTTVLTAALLLSGIPAEVINRSMDTYSKMGEVFTDLCVYFFTFIFCHELLEYWASEVPWSLKNSGEAYRKPISLTLHCLEKRQIGLHLYVILLFCRGCKTTWFGTKWQILWVCINTDVKNRVPISLTDFSCLIRIPSLNLSLTSKICILGEKPGLSC